MLGVVDHLPYLLTDCAEIRRVCMILNFLPLLALSAHSEHFWEMVLTDMKLGLGFSVFGSLARSSSFCRDMMHPDLKKKRKSFIFFVSWKSCPHFPKRGSSGYNLDALELKTSICLPLQLFTYVLRVRLGSLFLGKSCPHFPKNSPSGSNLDALETNISICLPLQLFIYI